MSMQLLKQGKNCDVYENSDYPDSLLFNRTNRVSVGDVILPAEIRYKGLIQNQMSIKWMNYLEKILKISNHLIATDAKSLLKFGATSSMAGSSVVALKSYPLPIECIVRGYYIPESKSWDPYKKTGEMYGNKLPDGLKESEKLPTPIYTPSTKADAGKHDENITFEQTIPIIANWLSKTFEFISVKNSSEILSKYEKLAKQISTELKEVSINAYEEAHKYALKQGIILADTKLEFGIIFNEDESYDLILIDEVFTPDSSRFWDAQKYELGKPQPSMDKQFLRRIVYNDLKWDRTSEPPEIPEFAKSELSEVYQNIYERLFGESVISLSEEIAWEWKKAEEFNTIELQSATTSLEIEDYLSSCDNENQ